MATQCTQAATSLFGIVEPTPGFFWVERAPVKPIQFNTEQTAHVALAQETAQMGALGMKAQFMVDDCQLIGRGLGGGKHILRLGDIEGSGLLADNMFAGAQCSNGDLSVNVGRRDNTN